MKQVCKAAYFGAVNDFYCLKILNDLATILPNSFQIHLCGRLTETTCHISDRIIYHGFLQGLPFGKFCDDADIFLNPRSYVYGVSDFCFPSKLYEYLSLGRPVVSTPIDHVTPDTKEFITFSRNFSAHSFSESMIHVWDNLEHYRKKSSTYDAQAMRSKCGHRIKKFLEELL